MGAKHLFRVDSVAEVNSRRRAKETVAKLVKETSAIDNAERILAAMKKHTN